ncbi:MAG: hypothetical protein JNM98_18700 [Rhodocyclaceae bacterium]|nr:hypothetical protein [Rhodocyclaceae bacterium]
MARKRLVVDVLPAARALQPHGIGAHRLFLPRIRFAVMVAGGSRAAPMMLATKART